MSDFRLFCWGAISGAGIHTIMRSLGMLTDAAMADLFGSRLDAMMMCACAAVILRAYYTRHDTAVQKPTTPATEG